MYTYYMTDCFLFVIFIKQLDLYNKELRAPRNKPIKSIKRPGEC